MAQSKIPINPRSMPKHEEKMGEAFSEDAILWTRIQDAEKQYPDLKPLFHDIIKFVLDVKNDNFHHIGDPASKKRKLETQLKSLESGDTFNNGTLKEVQEGTWADVRVRASWEAADVSFSLPQRKKFQVEVVKKDSKAGVKKGGIRAVSDPKGTNKKVEFGVGWGEIDQIFCLPVPDKAKKQHNFVVISKGGDGVFAIPDGSTAPESMIWTYEEPTGKNIVEGQDPGPGEMAKAISQHLALYGKKVVFPTEAEFASSIPQSHRKGEKAFHVRAFRGSKEGYLYFTSVGVLFGFKKPLAFFAFDAISSISYTSVLQRTFNLNIGAGKGEGEDEKEHEIEFSMLDQQDFAGIDDYVRKHKLNDASLAAARKAKTLNINGAKGKSQKDGVDAADEGAEEGETELQKAERQLQDEEDEEEEDYDPGSDADSDGSGNSDDEDDNGDDDAQADDDEEDGEGEDLVAAELGSDAEDVEMTDEED